MPHRPEPLRCHTQNRRLHVVMRSDRGGHIKLCMQVCDRLPFERARVRALGRPGDLSSSRIGIVRACCWAPPCPPRGCLPMRQSMRGSCWRCAEEWGEGMSRHRSRSGTLTFNMTHASARPREKVEWCPALLESKSLSDLVSHPRAIPLNQANS